MLNQPNYKFKVVFLGYVMSFALVCCSLTSLAQGQVLTADEAVRHALEYNYSIRIANNQAQISKNNVTPGNAGFLPSLDATATQNNNIQNSRQEYFSGQLNQRDNAKSHSINLGSTLAWTLFDGMAMFSNYQKLKEFEQLGQLGARLVIEKTITGVLQSYYDLIRQKQRLAVIEKNLTISSERIALAQEKLQLGAASRLEVLQAQVDFNTDKSDQLNSLEVYKNSKIKLNTLLARDVSTEFEVPDSIGQVSLPEWRSIYNQAFENNIGLMMNQSDLKVANYQIRELIAKRYPKLNLNMGYSYLNSESESGFIKTNQTSGLSYGLSTSLNLFNGLNLRRQISNARIQYENADLELSEYQQKLEADLRTAYLSLQSKLQLVEFELQNHLVAQNTLSVAMERYRLGELSGFELREAQRNFLTAESRLITARYQARLVELSLNELSGRIMK